MFSESSARRNGPCRSHGQVLSSTRLQRGPDNNVQAVEALLLPAGCAYVIGRSAQGRTKW